MKHPALNGSNHYRNFSLISLCRSHTFQLCQIITISTAYHDSDMHPVMKMYASVTFCFTSGPTSFPCHRYNGEHMTQQIHLVTQSRRARQSAC